MENSLQSSSSAMDFASCSNMSTSNQKHILKDNYSLEEVFLLKLKEIDRLRNELTELSDSENSLPPEQTFMNFTTFVKDKNNQVGSLCYALQSTKPSGYPKYRAEAYVKLSENLQKEEESLKDIKNQLLQERNEFSARTKRSKDQCAAMQQIIDNSVADKSVNSDIVAASERLLLTEVEKSKKHLEYVLTNIFPEENEGMREILSALVKTNSKSGESKWIKIPENADYQSILFLIHAGIIKQDPKDATKISLMSFGN